LDTDIINIQNNNLIVLDDLMSECINSEEIMNLFTVGSHQKNIGVFFLTQNIFSKGKFSIDISLNSNYMIIFKNPRDQQQLQILARQMYPNNSKLHSYIGQTSRTFTTRFKEHVNNICKFKNNIILNSELSLHFNKTKHNIYSDLRFFIFKDSLLDLNMRLSTETDLIHIFLALNLQVINKKLPDVSYIKKLSFT
jgi:hypothetical protein